MKTNVRIFEQPYNGNNYRQYFIEILVNKYPAQPFNMDKVGHIQFQTDKQNEEQHGDGKHWYACKFVCETENPDHLLFMGRLAKYIIDNSFYNRQPSEVLAIIGAQEHFSPSFACHYIPVSYKGRMKAFKVLREDGEHYSTIYAANEVQAEKLKQAKEKSLPGICKIAYWQEVN